MSNLHAGGLRPAGLPYTLARGTPSAPLRSRGSLAAARSLRTLIQVQQPVGRIHDDEASPPDPPTRKSLRPAVSGSRRSRPAITSRLRSIGPSTAVTRPIASPAVSCTSQPDQIVAIKRVRPAAAQSPTPASSTPRRPAPRRRSWSRRPRARSPAVPGGTAPTRSVAADVSACRPSARGRRRTRSSGKSVSGLTITCPRLPCAPGDAAHQQQIVRHLTCAGRRCPEFGTAAYWSRNSSVALPPSSSAAALTSVRSAARCAPAGRSPVPCRRAPSSARRASGRAPSRSVTPTASGLSGQRLRHASTTSRARLTTRLTGGP